MPRILLEALLDRAGEKQQLALGFGPDQKLLLLPARDVKTAFQSFLTSPFASEELASIRAVFFGTMQVCIPDKQGRIVIPPEMVKYANFGDEVTFVGTGDLVELWDTKLWKELVASKINGGQLSKQMREAHARASFDANNSNANTGKKSSGEART
ncbi:MAG: division/cell wall cluster transcriptional repressor MraZ [Planctomycetota bacterium]